MRRALILTVIMLSGVWSEARMPVNTPVETLVTGLDNARSLRISALGNLFIVETGRHRILKVGENGERLDSLGRAGSGDYQFDRPVDIDPTNEMKIYVADRNNRRIQVFDRRLQYLSTVGLPRRAGYGRDYRPSLVTADYTGRIYFFDDERHRVYRLDSNGQFDLGFELFSEQERITPVSMVMMDDELWVAGRRGELLHRFSSGGSYLGFIYAPEPVKTLRRVRRQLWMLGEHNLLNIDHTGAIRHALPLPGNSSQESGNISSGWLSFDIRNDNAYLLDGQKLVRISLEYLADERQE